MATVLVGNKIRQGLIMELIEPGLNDDGKPGIMPAAMDSDHQRVFLKGCSSQRVAQINPAEESAVFTEVDEAFAIEWFKRNAKLAFVKNGQVFMQSNAKDAKAQARDHKSVETGFEALNPAGDARLKKEAPKATPDFDSMPSVKRQIGA
jgi:hypothetical protein